MVKRIFNIFNKEIAGVHSAAFLLGFFALISQLLALFRDRLLAHFFGAGIELDIYYSAFRVPDFVFVTVASLVSVSVLVPFIVNLDSNNKEKVKEFIDNIVTFFLLIIILVSVLLFIFTPKILPVLFPGFSTEETLKLIDVTRILLLSPIFLGISNIFGAITQAYNRFVLYAISPVLYNIGIILGIVFLSKNMGIDGVAIGVIIGAFLHAFIQLPAVIDKGLFPSINFRFNWMKIKEVLLLSLPRTFTLSTNQLTLLVFISMASFMTAGSIAVFNFSLNLQSVPLSIIGVSYSLAAFPTLARLYKDNEMGLFVSNISIALKHIIFWSIPISVYFIVLRAQIIRVILGSGNFSWQDTRLTASSLALFTISVVAQGAVLLFVRAFYASGRTKIPLYINTIGMIVSVSLAFLLFNVYDDLGILKMFLNEVLRISDISGTEIIILPLAYSVGSIINFILLWIAFERIIGSLWKKIRKTLFDSVSSAFIGGVTAYFMLNIFVQIIEVDTLWDIFMQGFLAGIIGIIVNLLALRLLGNKELTDVLRTFRKRIFKTNVIVTDKEVL